MNKNCISAKIFLFLQNQNIRSVRKINLDIDMGVDGSSNWVSVWLASGTKIKMQMRNQIFNRKSGGIFSQPISIDCELNKDICGNADELHGDKVHKRLDGRRFRLWIEGIPFIFGIIRIDKEATVSDGQIEIQLSSKGKEWKKLTEGKNCQDIKPKDGICLGWGIKYLYTSKTLDEPYDEGKHIRIEIPPIFTTTHKRPKDNVGHGTWEDGSLLNITDAYPAKPYCNLRWCFQNCNRYSGEDWKKERAYGVIDPSDERPSYHEFVQSPVNFPHPPQFFVRYFLDSLFMQLGVVLDARKLDTISDFNRLFFYNTNLGFDLKQPRMSSLTKYFRTPGGSGATNTNTPVDIAHEHICKILGYQPLVRFWNGKDVMENSSEEKTNNTVKIIKNIGGKDKEARCYANGYVNLVGGWMYANGKNFPNQEIDKAIEAIENGFGMRLVYDSERMKAKFILLEDVLSSNEAEDVACIVSHVEKTDIDTRGFCLKYSADNDDTMKKQTEEKESFGDDFDLAFECYDQGSIVKRSFADTRLLVNSFEKRTIYDESTGDEYRYKINKDANVGDVAQYYPTTYEVAQFTRATEGDCSDDDYVETVEIGFAPLMFNDITSKSGYNGGREQVFAVFNDFGEQAALLFPETITERSGIDVSAYNMYKTGFNITIPTLDWETAVFGDGYEDWYDYDGTPASLPIWLGTIPYCHWDPASKELPLIGSDDKFAIGIMRGPGGDGGVVIIEDNADDEGNAKCATVAGKFASHFDTMDNFGNMFDYNGNGFCTTKDEAAIHISNEFPNSNADLLSPSRRVSSDTMKEKYPSFGDDYATVYSMTYTINGKYYLFTPITNEGFVFSEREMNSYIDTLKQSSSIWEQDKNSRKLLIGVYPTNSEADKYAIFLHSLHAIYYALEGEEPEPVEVPNGSGWNKNDLISLRIRAEKPNPQYNPDKPETDICSNGYPNTRFLPVTNELAKKRGLFDKFYKSFAYFELHKRKARYEIEDISIEELRSIGMHMEERKYRIADTIGLFDSVELSIDIDEGLEDVVMEMYYL